MSSFQDLKHNRSVRQKQFISTRSNIPSPENESAKPEREEVVDNEETIQCTKSTEDLPSTTTLHDLTAKSYPYFQDTIPSFIEVKETASHGRGVYAKTRITSGKLHDF